MYIYGNGEMKTFQGLQVTVTWALNLLRMVHGIIIYRKWKDRDKNDDKQYLR